MSSTAPRQNYEGAGDAVLGQQLVHEQMIRDGSRALHKALWRHHAGILEALERQGNGRVVVRP